MIDGGEGMVLSGIKAQQDVVLLRTGLEVAGEVELAFRQVVGRLERLEGLLVFQREDEDGRGRVDLGVGKDGVQHGAHALELVGEMRGLLCVAVGHDDEVRAAHLDPGGGGVAGEGRCQETQRRAEKEEKALHGALNVANTAECSHEFLLWKQYGWLRYFLPPMSRPNFGEVLVPLIFTGISAPAPCL